MGLVGDIDDKKVFQIIGMGMEKQNDFILIKEQLPEKGKDVIAISPDGEKHQVFRCACHNPDCCEWRCSLIGSGMIIDVESWKYV